METLKSLTAEERMQIAAFLRTEDWKLLERIAGIIISAGRINCSTFRATDPPGQHQFNQGCVAGLADFLAALEYIAQHAVEQKSEQEQAKEAPPWRRPLRSGTSGLV